MSIIPELRRRLRSFKCAGHGVWLTLRSQRNAQIHALATCAVATAGFVFGLSRTDWCLIVFACAAAWTAEALNTAVEFLSDAVTDQHHPLIGKAKDVAAGAVLISAIAAVTIGALVFWPHVAGLPVA